MDDQTPRGPDDRLRGEPLPVPLGIVLVEPEIPPNTGNIARLCAATGSELHLVHPLGFEVSDKAVRRAGLDYWHLVRVFEHQSWGAFEASRRKDARCHFFTGKAARSYLDVRFAPGDYLVFGRESVGLPDALLDLHQGELVGIPMPGAVRSLNLANASAIALYEALRQLRAVR